MIMNMIDKAEEAGRIKPKAGCTLILASTGSAGASAAMIGAMRGYKIVIITNPKCSKEKQDTIKMYGAQLIIAEPDQDCSQLEKDLAAAHPDWYPLN